MCLWRFFSFSGLCPAPGLCTWHLSKAVPVSLQGGWTWSNPSQPVTMLPARKAGKVFSVQRQFVPKVALPARAPAPGLVSVAAGKNVQMAHN